MFSIPRKKLNIPKEKLFDNLKLEIRDYTLKSKIVKGGIK